MAGAYTVMATDSGGCTQVSNVINYNSSGSGGIGLKVYPNPNSGQFTLQFQSSTAVDLNVTITNTLGQRVYQDDMVPGFSGVYNKTFNLQRLDAGMYYVKVLLGMKRR